MEVKISFIILLTVFHSIFAVSTPTTQSSHSNLIESCINDDCSAIRLTISNPPINLWTTDLIIEFNTYLLSLRNNTSTKVVVISSDTPGFYMAHLDSHVFTDATVNATQIYGLFNQNLDLLAFSPVIFIAEVNGRAWGGGNEVLLHMDMRFAGPDAQFCAPEVGLGITQVGGLQLLTNLIGRGRAAEYLLSAAQVEAEEAALVGWVNSAFSTKQRMRQHVNALAKKIGLFPQTALQAYKAGIAEQYPSQKSFQNDIDRYNALASTASAQETLEKFLVLSKDESKAWELNICENIIQIYTGVTK
ncbi:ClpP/crotonase-like domain-containing protein [Trichoderma barbatum]